MTTPTRGRARKQPTSNSKDNSPIPVGSPTGEEPVTPGGAREAFRRFASRIARWVGSPWAFTLALLAIVVWALLGPIYHYSDTWQLVINTGTTIVTFIMVFLIQNTQNRDARAIHLKLDELIHGVKGARNRLVDLENCSEEELEEYEKQFRILRKQRPKDGADESESETGNAEAGEV